MGSRKNGSCSMETNHPQIDPGSICLNNRFENDRDVRYNGYASSRPDQGFVPQRRNNHQRWCNMVNELSLPLRVYPEAPNTRHAGFAFPMMLDEDAPITRASCVQAREKTSKRVRYRVPTWQCNLPLTRYPTKD